MSIPRPLNSSYEVKGKDRTLSFLLDLSQTLRNNPEDPFPKRIIDSFKDDPLRPIPTLYLKNQDSERDNANIITKSITPRRKFKKKKNIVTLKQRSVLLSSGRIKTEESYEGQNQPSLEKKEFDEKLDVFCDRKLKHPLSDFLTNRATQELTLEELKESIKLYSAIDVEFSRERMEKLPNICCVAFKNYIYYGQLFEGMKSGQGITIQIDGKVYEGRWHKNQREGKGIEILLNGNSFEGEYKNNKPYGFGIYRWKQGEIYKGGWKNGVKEGYGEWIGLDNDYYKGEWKLGKPYGKGIYQWINGDKYEGQFYNSLKHGKGQEWFTNGDQFLGNYSYGKPEGFGEYKWKNGAIYQGDFRAGLKQGKGIFLNELAEKYEGEFKNDLKDGFGIYTWPSGNIYKGNYKNDLREGYGEMYWNDGSFYKGLWKGGVQNGEGELSVPGQKLLKGIFKNNVLVFEKSPHRIGNKFYQYKNLMKNIYKGPAYSYEFSGARFRQAISGRHSMMYNTGMIPENIEDSKYIMPNEKIKIEDNTTPSKNNGYLPKLNYRNSSSKQSEAGYRAKDRYDALNRTVDQQTIFQQMLSRFIGSFMVNVHLMIHKMSRINRMKVKSMFWSFKFRNNCRRLF